MYCMLIDNFPSSRQLLLEKKEFEYVKLLEAEEEERSKMPVSRFIPLFLDVVLMLHGFMYCD